MNRREIVQYNAKIILAQARGKTREERQTLYAMVRLGPLGMPLGLISTNLKQAETRERGRSIAARLQELASIKTSALYSQRKTLNEAADYILGPTGKLAAERQWIELRMERVHEVLEEMKAEGYCDKHRRPLEDEFTFLRGRLSMIDSLEGKNQKDPSNER